MISRFKSYQWLLIILVLINLMEGQLPQLVLSVYGGGHSVALSFHPSVNCGACPWVDTFHSSPNHNSMEFLEIVAPLLAFGFQNSYVQLSFRWGCSLWESSKSSLFGLSFILVGFISLFHHLLDFEQILILIAVMSWTLLSIFWHHMASCSTSSSVHPASRSTLSFATFNYSVLAAS